jgi:hypothetical protein
MSYLAHRRKYVSWPPGCVAYYKLDEASGAVIDSVAGNNGTNNGATTGATGKRGAAYILDGVNDYVNIDAVLTPIDSTTVGTLSAWVKPVDATPAVTNTIFSFSDTDQNTGIYIFLTSAFRFRIVIVLSGVSQVAVETDSNPFSDGVWTHLGIVINGVDAPVLYADGIAVPQTTSISTGNDGVWFNGLAGIDNGRLGCLNNASLGNRLFLDGSIDEVGIFNETLTSSQLTEVALKTYPFN